MKPKYFILILLLSSISNLFVFGQYKEFVYNDSIRQYAVYQPDLEYNPNGYPLVIGLHGANSEGFSFIATASLATKANKEKFIIAAPNGLRYKLLTWWNAGGLYEEITEGTDDIGFIAALIDTMIKNYNIDTTRIYVMGFSNGSSMAYRIAAELSDKIAAIGVCSGQMLYEYCAPEFPVPIIHFHGLADEKFPYFGSDTAGIPSVDSMLNIWRDINDCENNPDTIYEVPNITGKKWASSSGLYDVILYTNDTGQHKWPRPATWDLSATDIIWDFLKIHTRRNEPNIKAGFFKYKNERRTYLTYDPEPGSGPRPLVVGLHCHTGSALGFLSYTYWTKKAKEENFIGVFPNGLFYPIGTAWNVGSSFEQFTSGTDDVGFISALIDTIINNYEIDTTRIYVTGHSNGSMMSYRLAAELSHRIAAIGCVAAPMLYEYANPQFSVPIIHFHGLSDTTMPYEGKVEQFCTYPPMDSTLATWRKFNGCSETPEIIINEDGIHGKNWPSSDGKGDIVLYTIDSCMHDWPVFDKYGIDATDEIWNYFELQSKTAKPVENNNTNYISDPVRDVKICPNPVHKIARITYHLETASDVSLSVYDMSGREIEILFRNYQLAGDHEISWQHANLGCGVYLLKIKTNKISITQKLVIAAI